VFINLVRKHGLVPKAVDARDGQLVQRFTSRSQQRPGRKHENRHGDHAGLPTKLAITMACGDLTDLLYFLTGVNVADDQTQAGQNGISDSLANTLVGPWSPTVEQPDLRLRRQTVGCDRTQGAQRSSLHRWPSPPA
jgi:hypothetical protein